MSAPTKHQPIHGHPTRTIFSKAHVWIPSIHTLSLRNSDEFHPFTRFPSLTDSIHPQGFHLSWIPSIHKVFQIIFEKQSLIHEKLLLSMPMTVGTAIQDRLYTLQRLYSFTHKTRSSHIATGLHTSLGVRRGVVTRPLQCKAFNLVEPTLRFHPSKESTRPGPPLEPRRDFSWLNHARPSETSHGTNHAHFQPTTRLRLGLHKLFSQGCPIPAMW